MCDTCEKIFASDDQLEHHDCENIHTLNGIVIKRYRCTICARYFVTKGAVYLHKVSHFHKQKYHCYICQLGFKLKRERDDHQKTHETNLNGSKLPSASCSTKNFTSATKENEIANDTIIASTTIHESILERKINSSTKTISSAPIRCSTKLPSPSSNNNSSISSNNTSNSDTDVCLDSKKYSSSKLPLASCSSKNLPGTTKENEMANDSVIASTTFHDSILERKINSSAKTSSSAPIKCSTRLPSPSSNNNSSISSNNTSNSDVCLGSKKSEKSSSSSSSIIRPIIRTINENKKPEKDSSSPERYHLSSPSTPSEDIQLEQNDSSDKRDLSSDILYHSPTPPEDSSDDKNDSHSTTTEESSEDLNSEKDSSDSD